MPMSPDDALSTGLNWIEKATASPVQKAVEEMKVAPPTPLKPKHKHATVYVPVDIDLPSVNRRLVLLGGKTANQYLTQALLQIARAAEEGRLPLNIALE